MNDEIVEAYMAFRKELDRMWVPRVIGAFSKINVIEHNGEMYGMM